MLRYLRRPCLRPRIRLLQQLQIQDMAIVHHFQHPDPSFTDTVLTIQVLTASMLRGGVASIYGGFYAQFFSIQSRPLFCIIDSHLSRLQPLFGRGRRAAIFGLPYAAFLHQRLQSLHAAPKSLTIGSCATRKLRHDGMADGLESCDPQVQSKKRQHSAEIAWLDKRLAKQCRRAEEAEERAKKEVALKKQARQDRAAAI